MDWLCCREAPAVGEKDTIKLHLQDIKTDDAKNLDTVKRLIFTFVGIILSLILILELGVENVGFLHSAGLVKLGPQPWGDTIYGITFRQR